jgi:cytochrome c-type biogenesis protein CcmH/NrfG
MTNQSSHPELGTRQELEKERNLRKKYETQASATEKELMEKEAALEKYKRLPLKLDKYRHRSRRLRRQRNFYRTVSLVLLLIVGYFLVERYQKARELDKLRNEIKAAGAPKKVLPGIITQEAMERDAEAQGGSLITDK